MRELSKHNLQLSENLRAMSAIHEEAELLRGRLVEAEARNKELALATASNKNDSNRTKEKITDDLTASVARERLLQQQVSSLQTELQSKDGQFTQIKTALIAKQSQVMLLEQSLEDVQVASEDSTGYADVLQSEVIELKVHTFNLHLPS
jgi:septal ring factor EnvC (AmiA/AmiB activator)